MIKVRVEAIAMGNIPGTSLMLLRPAPGQDVVDRILPICIGSVEAASIGKALANESSARPMTHGLLLTTIAQLDGKVIKVVIDRVRGAVFYASVTIERNNTEVKIDARPSDAVAVAIRAGAPIYVADEVMSRAGWAAWMNADEGHKEMELADFRTFIEEVVPDDFTL